MGYRYGERVRRNKRMVKRYLIGAAASLAMIAGASAPAFAASTNYCGSSDTGCDAAFAAGAQCGTGGGSGSYGAFGTGYNFAGGADGTQTGLNNSAVCGSRPGN